mgnify:CR=1 FL=1
MTSKLRVGVIGRGKWGKRIVETLQTKTQHCECTWTADSHSQFGTYFLNPIGDTHPADFVVIATPYSTHAQLMRKCCEQGLPFIVEKPAAPIWELKKLHDDFPVTRPFLCNHTLLFNPAVETMVKFAQGFIHQGTPIELRGEHGGLGPVRIDCNALLDYGSHGIALALWLSGAKRVQALRLYCGEQNESVAVQGVPLYGAQNFIFEARFEHLKVQLRIGNNYPKKRLLYTIEYDIGQGAPITHRFREFPERELLSYIGSDLIEVPFTAIDPLTNVLDTFARVVKGEVKTDARFGWNLPLETMRVLETCNELLRAAPHSDSMN